MKTVSSSCGPNSGPHIFGVESTFENAHLILIPVPWEATTSYGNGTAHGPQAILQASQQVDLYYHPLGRSYDGKAHMLPIAQNILELSQQTQLKVQQPSPHTQNHLDEINAASTSVNQWVFEQSLSCLQQGKFVGVVGGDHSCPYGAVMALAKFHHNDYGILHIDAHADLRCAYQGFVFSHASIMYNIMESPFAPRSLIQVGVRDFCHEEFDYMKSRPDRITTFFDHNLRRQLYQGSSWQSLCDEILSRLPAKVYISFDIDGLTPSHCPHTGTPVPGGLDFSEAIFLLQHVHESGRQIIGFDISEVTPNSRNPLDQWDANVGARLLLSLCHLTLA